MSEEGILKVLGWVMAIITALGAFVGTRIVVTDKRQAARIASLEREVEQSHENEKARAARDVEVFNALKTASDQLESLSNQMTAQDAAYVARFKDVVRHIEEVKSLVRNGHGEGS